MASDDEPEVGSESYQRFLNVIRAQTGGPSQHPMVDITGVATVLGYTDEDVAVDKAVIVGTQQHDHIIKWEDDGSWTCDGAGCRTRIALTMEGCNEAVGGYPYGAHDIECIERIQEIEASKENPDKCIIGWANRHLDAIEERTTDAGAESNTGGRS